jgi:hypothetical protein
MSASIIKQTLCNFVKNGLFDQLTYGNCKFNIILTAYFSGQKQPYLLFVQHKCPGTNGRSFFPWTPYD